MDVMSQTPETSTPSPLQRGTRVADHWTVGARWARFGDLHFHAGTSEIDVDIAAWRYQGPLKRFLESLEADRQRFGSLVHPQVCRTFDVDRIPDTLTCYWVQESPGGVPLLQHLHERSVVTPDLTVNLGLQIAFGLDAIHRAGLVHGDLDPEFIRVIGKDRIKLSWAGLANRIESAGLDAGRGGARSLAEVAPETLRDGTVDFASDSYAFAALLYRMLSGSSPYLVRKNGPPPGLDPSEPLDRLPKTVPEALLPPLRAALGQDRGKRPTIEEWIETLRLVERQLVPSVGQWSSEAPPRRDQASDGPVRTVPSALPANSLSPQLRIDSTIGNVPRSGRTSALPAPPRADGKPAPSPGVLGSSGTIRPRHISMPPPSVSLPPRAARVSSGASLPSLLAATTLMALVVLGGVAILGSVAEPPAPAENEVRVPATPTRLPAIVTIASHPPGATVYEGSKAVGTTPMELVLDVESYEGTRDFRLVLDGYSDYSMRQPWVDEDQQRDVVLLPANESPSPRQVIIQTTGPDYELPPEGEPVDEEVVPEIRDNR